MVWTSHLLMLCLRYCSWIRSLPSMGLFLLLSNKNNKQEEAPLLSLRYLLIQLNEIKVMIEEEEMGKPSLTMVSLGTLSRCAIENMDFHPDSSLRIIIRTLILLAMLLVNLLVQWKMMSPLSKMNWFWRRYRSLKSSIKALWHWLMDCITFIFFKWRLQLMKEHTSTM